MPEPDKYSLEIPDKKLVERVLAGRPDAKQLCAFLSRSYTFIRTLPLKGLIENYSKANNDLSEAVS
jgi:hypothetical protein